MKSVERPAATLGRSAMRIVVAHLTVAITSAAMMDVETVVERALTTSNAPSMLATMAPVSSPRTTPA